MNRRMLTVVSLGLLLIQGTLLSQERAAAMASQARIVRIMEIRNRFPEDVARILKMIYGGEENQFVIDEPLGRLLVHTTAARMPEIEQLVAELDAAGAPASQRQAMQCRVYMVEPSPKQSDLESFQIMLAAPLDADLWGLLKSGQEKGFQIDRFDSRAVPEESAQRVEIQGRAVSSEAVKQVIAGIPDARILDMRWAGKTSNDVTPVAQVSQLPEPLRQHLQKFLGADLQAVGYWFGGMSSPGKIKAPIGSWSIELDLKPAQADGLSIEVGVTEWRNDSSWSILENSMQGKVGKPIIIGYNRDSFGVRTMGAMVILLEADTSGAAGS